MATVVTNTIQEIENLETLYLIWLSSSINIEIQQQLRTIINYFLPFEDKKQCLKYIQSLSKDDRIILIINGKYGQQIIPQIVHLQQIISIYVCSHDKKSTEHWTKNFKKIQGVITRRDELIQRIQSDHNQRQLHHIDETLSINIFNPKLTGEIVLSSSLNNHFIHFQILIDCLIHLEPCLNDKNEFISLCKQQYNNNPNELNIIEEFEKTYLSERALWWYSRHSFIYRLLNKAIRMENIHLLLLLRFFICDIKRELKKIKSSSSIRVYRAQLMSKEELDILIKFVGTFISINSFLSTSPNREQTRSFLISSALSTDLESVFIEIDANHQLDNNQNFGNITSYSYFPNKEEILFMMGSIFRLVHIDRDIDGIWNIQLNLCSNKDQQIQTFIQHKKNELDIIEKDLLSFGFVLEDMGKLDDAEIYYHRVLNQLSKDHEDIPRCYHALGEVTQKKGDYDSSLKWYKKSLEIDDSNIATSHNSIAVVYSKKGDYVHALESFSKALEIWKKTYGEDHPDVAMCFNNMGIIYQEEMKYSEALEYYHKAWNIRQKYLPTEHPSLGQSHACIGNVRYHLKHYDLALEHYNLALENFKTSLFPHHPDIAMVFRNIGLVYQDKGDFQQSLLYVEKAATIYRHSLPVTHPDIIQIEQIIRKISSKL